MSWLKALFTRAPAVFPFDIGDCVKIKNSGGMKRMFIGEYQPYSCDNRDFMVSLVHADGRHATCLGLREIELDVTKGKDNEN